MVSRTEAVAAIVEHHARLRALLARFEPSILATRPPSGDWAAIENVRHLVFTAQRHLGPFAPDGLGWSRMGLAQGQHADVNATTDVAAVLDEWDRGHAAAFRLLDLTDPELTVDVPLRGGRVLSDQSPDSSATNTRTADRRPGWAQQGPRSQLAVGLAGPNGTERALDRRGVAMLTPHQSWGAIRRESLPSQAVRGRPGSRPERREVATM